MEAHFIGFNMWVKAVEKVKSTEPDKVIEALPGIQAPNLTGGTSTMLPNHHITKPVYIGEVRADGQFKRGVQDARLGSGRGPGRLTWKARRTWWPTGSRSSAATTTR